MSCFREWSFRLVLVLWVGAAVAVGSYIVLVVVQGITGLDAPRIAFLSLWLAADVLGMVALVVVPVALIGWLLYVSGGSVVRRLR